MMTAEELCSLAHGVRRGTVPVDEALLGTIEAEIDVYRALATMPRPQLPPPALVERLPMMGWLLYEASLRPLWGIAPRFEALTGEALAENLAASSLITRTAHAARQLPWPEFAPRALGAIRSEALVASKRDTEFGYNEAWALHSEAKRKHAVFADSHAAGDQRDRHILALDEVLIQLALAEAGTACRTAERVVGRWSEGVEEGTWAPQDGGRWTQRMFRELSEGASYGEMALQVASRIEDRHGFVHDVDEHRMTLTTGYQNPAIMTARANLLMLSMCSEMEALGRQPPGGAGSWSQAQSNLLRSFESAYRYIEKVVVDSQGERLPLNAAHRRSIVQLRLHLALLCPGYSLPAMERFAPCLDADPLDDEAAEALATWLAEPVDGKVRGDDGKVRGDANVIGSATKPGFIRSVEACRRAAGVTGGYREWRVRWFTLDRYAQERDRRERVLKALAEA
jgi:hypothetical protein